MLAGPYTRHDILRLGGAALAAVALPRPLLAEAPGKSAKQEKHVLFFTKSAAYEHAARRW
jgi:hypothetical protein